MDKYKNQYRIPSARAQWWDYAWDGSYFITICTRNMKHFFGRVRNKKMELSRTGIIAELCWHDLPNHAKNIELGEHVVMPNHMHGIITLIGNAAPFRFVVQTRPALSPPCESEKDLSEEDATPVEYPPEEYPPAGYPAADHFADFQSPPDLPQTLGRMRFRNPGKNTLSTILGGYKSAVSRETAKAGLDFAWHARFHDHIIRDAGEYQRITNYIRSNSANWEADKYYSDPNT